MPTPTFEEILLGGGVYEGLPCEEKLVHAVEAESTWAMVLLDCQHVSVMCSACKRDVELRMGQSARPGALLGMLHAAPCGTSNYRWRWEQL